MKPVIDRVITDLIVRVPRKHRSSALFEENALCAVVTQLPRNLWNTHTISAQYMQYSKKLRVQNPVCWQKPFFLLIIHLHRASVSVSVYCLINFTDHIHSETAKGHVTSMVMIDFRKAFDTCDHSILLSKLDCMGIGPDRFRSYLSGQRQCVKLDDTISPFLDVTCGVPQGSILGPTLLKWHVRCP